MDGDMKLKRTNHGSTYLIQDTPETCLSCSQTEQELCNCGICRPCAQFHWVIFYFFSAFYCSSLASFVTSLCTRLWTVDRATSRKMSLPDCKGKRTPFRWPCLKYVAEQRLSAGSVCVEVGGIFAFKTTLPNPDGVGVENSEQSGSEKPGEHNYPRGRMGFRRYSLQQHHQSIEKMSNSKIYSKSF